MPNLSIFRLKATKKHDNLIKYPDAAPSSSGLGLLAFIQAIVGSTPTGVTMRKVILLNLVALVLFVLLKGNNGTLVSIILSILTAFFVGFLIKKKGWLYGLISALFPYLLAFFLLLILYISDPDNLTLNSILNSVGKYSLTIFITGPIGLMFFGALFGFLGEKASKK